MNTELSLIYKWIRIALIILAIFLGVQTLGGLRDLRNTDPAYNSITVNGEGEVFSIPDLATFSFSVSADAKTAALAQEQVTEKMDAILASLKALGIEEKDIKTSDYSVYPKYRYETVGNPIQDGFTVTHTVSVKVRKTDDAGKALAIAGEKGATNLSSVSFTVGDPEELNQEARSLAIKDAREKAKALSKELGVRLVRVVSYSDSSNGGVTPFYRVAVDMGGDAIIEKAPTLPMGENKVKVVVNVSYEIR